MKANKDGMTLIEAIVSIFIVTFMLVGMMRLYSLGRIQSVIARHKIMAINQAQAEIEGLKNTPYNYISIGTFTQTVIIDTGETDSTSDDITGTMLTEISSIDEGYKLIVTVSWNDYYGAQSEILESSITSYQ